MYACRSGGASVSVLQHVASPKSGLRRASPFFYFFDRPTEPLSAFSSKSTSPYTSLFLRCFSTTERGNGPNFTIRKESKRRATPRALGTPRQVTRRKTLEPVGNDFIDGHSSNANSESSKKAKREDWMIQKSALEDKFSEGWDPRKKLSPDALDGIRALHAQQPEVYTTEVLASEFEVSAEAIRRILKSKWRPKESEAEDRRLRWERRGESIWTAKIATGYKAPKRWRDIMRHRSQHSGDAGVTQVMKHRAARAIVQRGAEMREKEREEQQKAMEEQEPLKARAPDYYNSNG